MPQERQWIEQAKKHYFYKMIKAKQQRPGVYGLLKAQNGKEINYELLKSIDQSAANIAKKVPKHSTFVIGPTGKCKTLIAKYWYNRIAISQGTRSRLHWIKESEVADEILTNETIHHFASYLNKMEIAWLFLDDIFWPSVWRNRNSTGHYNQKLYSGFSALWDFLYENKGKIQVVATSNCDPQVFFRNDTVWQPLLRRFNEIFGDKKNWIRLG